MEEYKLPTMEELGVMPSSWDDPRIKEFYQLEIYPELDNIFLEIKNDIDNQIQKDFEKISTIALSSTKVENIRQRIAYMQKGLLKISDIINDVKTNYNPSYVMLKLNLITQHHYNRTASLKILKLLNKIEAFFQPLGYAYRYFMFFDENSYMYNINVNNTKLRFNISESGYCGPDSDNLSKLIFDRFSNIMRAGAPLSHFNHLINSSSKRLNDLNYEFVTGGYDYIGWSKTELISALKESEFFEEHVDEITNSSGFTNYIYTYSYFGDNVKRKLQSKRNLPIFEYVPKLYLELIYRYINNYKDINLRSLCKSPYIDNITLYRMLDKFDPTFLNGKYKELSVNEICNVLGVDVITSSMLEIPQLSQDILYQPGGRYEKEVRKKYNTFMGVKEEEKIEIKEIYNKYLLNCEDKTIPIQSVIFDAIELGLFEQINRNMTREEICEIIRQYIVTLYKEK